MEDKKTYYLTKYKELKILKKGVKPLRNEFLQFCKIGGKELDKTFGKDPYSKLQKNAGDDPNKLELERTPILEILENFGNLVRLHKRKIVMADWMEANYSPTPDGIRVVHNIKWSELPNAFVENFKTKAEWSDVLEILNPPNSIVNSSKNEKFFNEIVDKIARWTPDRKRIIEEGYKIELRKYLEAYFNLDEEFGESNPDILINKKFPIEVKKDPSLSEYDRLLGQMIRHHKVYGSAIAIITNVSSQDRFLRFQKLFIEVQQKLNMTAELFLK